MFVVVVFVVVVVLFVVSVFVVFVVIVFVVVVVVVVLVVLVLVLVLVSVDVGGAAAPGGSGIPLVVRGLVLFAVSVAVMVVAGHYMSDFDHSIQSIHPAGPHKKASRSKTDTLFVIIFHLRIHGAFVRVAVSVMSAQNIGMVTLLQLRVHLLLPVVTKSIFEKT